jgi:adenosylmethionine-8-amino-7-oxononanoate aminotransferase
MSFDASPARTTNAAFVPHGAPFAVARAEGAYLVTPAGQRILDAAGGAIVANIGHGRREVAEVAAAALERCTYVVPPFATEDRLKLVERLQKSWLPPSLTRITFTSGGSESVEAALRLARQHHLLAGRPDRWKVIGTDLSYHGVSLGALSVANHAARRAPFEPMLIPFPKTPAPYVIPGLEHAEHPADALERVILAEDPETVAAFICEPVVGAAGGALVPVDDFWPRAREICSRYGVLLIADEVMSGFGRTGKKFAVEHWGVEPDILVGGKGLSGGYAPIGGVYASEAVVAPLAAERQDLMFYTYSGHPASCAVAEKVLEIMEREDLVARSERMGALLRQRLDSLADHPNVAEIRGLGLMLGVEFVKDRRTMERFPAEAKFATRLQGAALRQGVFLYAAGSGPVRDAALFGPPFTINGEDIDLIVDTLAAALDETVAQTAKNS